jgi:hypothetical protein
MEMGPKKGWHPEIALEQMQVLLGLLPLHPQVAHNIVEALTPLVTANAAERNRFVHNGRILQFCQVLQQQRLPKEVTARGHELLCLVCQQLHESGDAGVCAAVPDESIL